MMTRILLTAVMATLVATQPLLAGEQNIEPNDYGQIEFRMPSGNIGCIYTPEGGTDVYQPEGGGAELSCDRVEPSYVRVVLGSDDDTERYDDVGDAGCCGGKKLAYGNWIELGPFTCWSETTGLTCERDDDTGFLISKATIKLF